MNIAEGASTTSERSHQRSVDMDVQSEVSLATSSRDIFVPRNIHPGSSRADVAGRDASRSASHSSGALHFTSIPPSLRAAPLTQRQMSDFERSESGDDYDGEGDEDVSVMSDLPPLTSAQGDYVNMAPPHLTGSSSFKGTGKRTVDDAGISPPSMAAVSESSKRSSKRVNVSQPDSMKPEDVLFEMIWNPIHILFIQDTFRTFSNDELDSHIRQGKADFARKYPKSEIPSASHTVYMVFILTDWDSFRKRPTQIEHCEGKYVAASAIVGPATL